MAKASWLCFPPHTADVLSVWGNEDKPMAHITLHQGSAHTLRASLTPVAGHQAHLLLTTCTPGARRLEEHVCVSAVLDPEALRALRGLIDEALTEAQGHHSQA